MTALFTTGRYPFPSCSFLSCIREFPCIEHTSLIPNDSSFGSLCYFNVSYTCPNLKKKSWHPLFIINCHVFHPIFGKQSMRRYDIYFLKVSLVHQRYHKLLEWLVTSCPHLLPCRIYSPMASRVYRCLLANVPSSYCTWPVMTNLVINM